MSNAFVLSGSTIEGRNRILPWTVVMKDDEIPSGTNWCGIPARQAS